MSVNVVLLIERRTGTSLTRVRFPGAARDFYPRVNFKQRHPPVSITCINVCARVKDPVVYARVRWIMETLKHPPHIVGWVARVWLIHTNFTFQAKVSPQWLSEVRRL